MEYRQNNDALLFNSKVNAIRKTIRNDTANVLVNYCKL